MISTGLTLLLISYSVTAQFVEPQDCPKVETKQNLEYEAYLGTWYVYERVGLGLDYGHRCSTEYYEANPNGTIKIEYTTLTSDGRKIHLEGYNVANTHDKSKFTTIYPSITVSGPYWVLDTDYTSYTVVWSCFENGSQRFQSFWAMTRERNPSAAVVKNIHDVLEKNKLNQSILERVDQANCPENL